MLFKSRFTTPAVAALCFCSIGGTTPTYADLGDQLFKLLPDDGASSDWFGHSVAISGDTAIVGANRDDDKGNSSGSAYLFDTTTGLQLFKLLPNDGSDSDEFGFSVAISGATAIVGARWDDDNGVLSGSAYIFDANTGLQLFKLLPNDGHAFDDFSHSVAISGNIAIIGAPGWFDLDTGAAYLFDTTTGQQLFRLQAEDDTEDDNFGISVAISGTTAIIGAYRDDDNGSASGAAYLFDTTTGQQIAKLLPNDGAADDWFGHSVAISGPVGEEIAIVGARQDDDNGDDSGSAYLFCISDPSIPVQIAKLLPDDGAENDWFGNSVAISGTIAIVGARRDDDNGDSSGSAYLFDINTGQQIAKLLPNDGASKDEFGFSVAISDGTAIAGALWDDDNGTNSGSAYLFDAAAPGMCPWDIDGSGSVGASDLLALLATWGPCKGCPADFDGNGSVGASDLLALLANWGPCP